MLLTVGVCVLLILLALFQVMPPKEHGKGKGKGTAAVDSDGILCGSSDSDSSEAPSLSTVNTSTTRSSNSSRNSLKKTKKLKKKSKKKKDKSCDFCDSIVEDPCPLQELLNLQMSTHVEKTIMWGRPNKEGNQCYMCKRTRRVKVRWSVLTSADLKEELNDDTNKDEFLTDRDAVVSLLAEKGPNERISLDDLDQRIEVLHDEAAGERAWRAGTKFSEGVFNSRFSLEEQKKMDFKKESQKNLRTGKVELFYRVFDDEEGVERFESYQDRKTSKRRKLGDTIASNEDQEETQRGKILAAIMKVQDDATTQRKDDRESTEDLFNDTVTKDWMPWLFEGMVGHDANPDVKRMALEAADKANINQVYPAGAGSQQWDVFINVYRIRQILWG